VIAQMAEEVIVMYLGKIVERADVKTLFNDPKHPYTQELMRSIPKLTRSGINETLATIEGSVPPAYLIPPGCSFHPRCFRAKAGVCDTISPNLTEVGPKHEANCLIYAPDGQPGPAA